MARTGAHCGVAAVDTLMNLGNHTSHEVPAAVALPTQKASSLLCLEMTCNNQAVSCQCVLHSKLTFLGSYILQLEV